MRVWSLMAAVAVALRAAQASAAPTPIPLKFDTSASNTGGVQAIIGYWCGGASQQDYVTGFTAADTITGAVFLETKCSSGGKGSPGSLYSGWASTVWDLTGALVSDAVLSPAPTVNPALIAFDGAGNEIYNTTAYSPLNSPLLQGGTAFLVLGAGAPVPEPGSVWTLGFALAAAATLRAGRAGGAFRRRSEAAPPG